MHEHDNPHSCMTNTLALLQSENKYIFLLGDYNVDISPVAKHNLANEELKKIFYHLNIVSLSLLSPLERANILTQ